MKQFNWQCLGLLATTILGANAAPNPTATIHSPEATFVGIPGDVEQFLAVPFAKPPVGSRRLRPPEPLTEPLGEIQANSSSPICPQFLFEVFSNDIAGLLGKIINSQPVQQAFGENEDCLYLNIFRPAGTKPGDKLPVLFYIFGGGFENGFANMYNGVGPPWVSQSVAQGEPIIYVNVAYRLAGFGFLPGKEILEDGSANLGLLDQRLALQWTADNIEAFGGDPDGITLWGESAGAISIWDQLLMYDGDNTYKGKPLFRGGIMNSGNIVPTHPVDHPKPQDIYNRVVDACGCSSQPDSLECLRGLDYQTFLNATSSVHDAMLYTGLALSYLPRPDGVVLTDSPDALTKAGKYAQVPVIIGDQEDEGSLYASFQENITTEQDLNGYLRNYFFDGVSEELMQELINLYADDNENGSPFRTGDANRWYPQFKRLAAILGDSVFNLARRITLQTIEKLTPNVPTWSYLSSYDHGTPILGTFHASDVLQVMYGIKPNYAAASFKEYYISFVNHLDPNKGVSDPATYREWPRYSDGHQLLQTYGDHSEIIPDTFRQNMSDFIDKNYASFEF